MRIASMAPGGPTDITTVPGALRMVICTPAAAATTLTVADSGTTLFTVQAAANGNSVVMVFNDPINFGTKLTCTLAGAASAAYFGF